MNDGKLKPRLIRLADAGVIFGFTSPIAARRFFERQRVKGYLHLVRLGRRVFIRAEDIKRIVLSGVPSGGLWS